MKLILWVCLEENDPARFSQGFRLCA